MNNNHSNSSFPLNSSPEMLINIHKVISYTGLSKSTIYLKIQQNQFPRPVAVGSRAKRWKMSHIQEWIQTRI